MIEISERDDVRVLRLAHGKASALDLELVIALREALDQAGKDRARAVVLTGSAHIFCAGVDLFRVVDGGADYVQLYLRAFKELMFSLFTPELPLIVAANGHAMAGGAVLVAAGDYRLMATGQGRFGYTELRVGVPFPPAALEIIRFATPQAHVEQLLYTGETFLPDQTFAFGVVDELVEADRLMPRALEVAARLGAIPRDAFVNTKRQMRAAALDRMHSGEAVYGEEVAGVWASEATHTAIRAYLASTVRKPRS